MPVTTQAGTGVPDFQQWSELDAIIPVSTNTSVTAIGQARFSESLPNPVYTSAAADFNYKDGSWTLAVGYRHQVTAHQSDEPTVTQLARVTATYAQAVGRDTLALRCRVENTIHASGNPWRVRLRAEYRWATPALGRVPYWFANDEVFYDFQDDVWYRNRFQAGANLVFTKDVSTRLYYQRQDDKFNNPGALNVLGLVVVVDFK